jgi:DNA modification methylase
MIQIPERELVPIEQLKVDGDNPNQMTDKQHARLKTSIEKYGFIVPIITNKDLLIADGEQRLTVAQSLQMHQVPVIRLPVEDVDRRLLRQVLNKLRGEHELLLDAQEFEKIIEAGGEDDLKHLLDLSDSGLEKYLREIREPHEESYEVPEIDKIETDIKRGDIYKLGEHRLMCGDATQDIPKLLGETKADVLLTDPPYGINIIKGKQGSLGLSKTYTSVINDDKPFNPEHLLSLANIQILFGANYYADKLPCKSGWIVWYKHAEQTILPTQSDCELIWTNQDKPIRLYKCVWTGYFREGENNKTPRIHPTQKPIKLLSTIVQNYSHNPQIILDPYGGSGSTLIACEQTGRACYMMEIDPRYCQVIIDRWQKYTGQKAVKITKQ